MHSGNISKLEYPQHYSLKPFGFRISDDYIWLNEEQILIHIAVNGCRLRLRPTMATFLTILLGHPGPGTISDEEIIFHVWRTRRMKSARPRFREIIQELRQKLKEAGLEKDLFQRAGECGYKVNHDLIQPLCIRH